MTGINRSYLADIEKGHRNFGFDTLEKIVEGFGISYSESSKGSNQSNPPKPPRMRSVFNFKRPRTSDAPSHAHQRDESP